MKRTSAKAPQSRRARPPILHGGQEVPRRASLAAGFVAGLMICFACFLKVRRSGARDCKPSNESLDQCGAPFGLSLLRFLSSGAFAGLRFGLGTLRSHLIFLNSCNRTVWLARTFVILVQGHENCTIIRNVDDRIHHMRIQNSGCLGFQSGNSQLHFTNDL